jgi:dihydrofolate reductase
MVQPHSFTQNEGISSPTIKGETAMRKIIVLEFITLDGVMQAPGGVEDTSGGFKYGGWSAPYFYEADEAAGEFMAKHMKSADLLLGRKTFETFASFWPTHGDLWPGVNDVTKYVMSKTMNKNQSDWKNIVFLKSVDDIKKLKNSEGTDIQVHGSGNLIQTLLKHDLVDELWLKTFPITLGQGKKLFDDGTSPAAFTLTDSLVTPNGVIFANYKRAGEVKTGTVGE